MTVYYVAGAILSAWMAGAYERFGPRLVVTGGTLAMALGVSALGTVGQPWHLYPVFLLMAIGWGSMGHFAALIRLVVAISQFTFAFDPSLVGFIRDGSGGYGPALALWVVLQLLAAALVLRGR